VILVSSVEVEEVLLALKIGFLVLLYLFIWRIVRTASRDLRLPQESFILAPDAARRSRREEPPARLTVLSSPSLSLGAEHVLDSAPVTVGRSSDNDLPLAGDDFASVRHARFEPRRDGVWVEDIGSTNGTFVNGIRLEQPRRLTSGDVVRIGETDLRFDA
jgi:pSer/pThr/pTyr-binding forkhead associated (FHA) protein